MGDIITVEHADEFSSNQTPNHVNPTAFDFVPTLLFVSGVPNRPITLPPWLANDTKITFMLPNNDVILKDFFLLPLQDPTLFKLDSPEEMLHSSPLTMNLFFKCSLKKPSLGLPSPCECTASVLPIIVEILFS